MSFGGAAIENVLPPAHQLSPQLYDNRKRSSDIYVDEPVNKHANMAQPFTFSSMPQQQMMGMGMAQPLMGLPNQVGQNGGGDDMEILEVPNNTVGLIIGKGGEQISTIQRTCSCRVQMSPDDQMSTGIRRCTLTGHRDNINQAKAMIMEIIARANDRQQNRGDNGFQNGGGNVVITVAVPPNRAGLVIGKGGEVIKNLQERTGARMNMIQDSTTDQGSKSIRIQGDAQKVEAARRLVEEIINTGQTPRLGGMGGGMSGQQMNGMGGGQYGGQGGGGYGGGGNQVGEVIVPRSAVGMIIGKQGENIKRMAMESGARIQFKPDDPTQLDRVCIVQGTLESINRATVMITQCVTKSEGGGGMMGSGGNEQQTFYMHVPASKCGLVIGRQGETIKQINAESQAHVELQRDNSANPSEKVFTIKGSPFQIHVATHLIRIKVGDIPPGTPVPPFHGGQDSAQPMGQFPSIGQYQPQPATNMQQQPQGDNAWASYYAQQGGGNQYGGPGGQQFPQGHTMPQQGGQPGAGGAPSINPLTGAPDYSQQWIEYYRTIGLHEQAAMIEQQARQQREQAVQRQGGGMPPQQAGAPQPQQFGQQYGAPQQFAPVQQYGAQGQQFH